MQKGEKAQNRMSIKHRMREDRFTLREIGLLLLHLPFVWGLALLRWVADKIVNIPIFGVPILLGMFLSSRLESWRHPATYSLREELFHQQSPWLKLELSNWVSIENRTQTVIRVYARDVEGWCPPQFRGQGVRLRPGQKVKFPIGSRHLDKYILEFSRIEGDSCFIVVAPDPYA